MPRIPTGTKLSDLEEGLLPWVSAKPPERPSTSTAKECEVKLDDLNGLFFSQGARYGIHDILRGNHIVGISRREPYNYDNYHRQYRPPFPPEPRAPRRYDQDRRARKYNLHSFQRETLEEESIFYSPNDRTEPKTERPTSEDVRSREKHILIIQDNSKSKGKKVETSSSSHQLPGSGSNNSHEPGATGFKSEDILSNDQASQIVEEKNESLNQRTEASSVSDELSETGSNSSHDSMGSTSRPRRSRDRRAEDYYSDDLWNARLYESDRRRASPQTPYAPYFSTRPPMPYHPQMPQYYYPQISPEPQMSDYTPMPPPPRAVPPPLIPDPPQTLLPYTYTAPSHIPEEIQAKEKQKTLKSSKLSDLKFHDRLTAAGINAVYYRSPPEEPLSYNIALNSLQRMVMHELQGELVGVVQKIVQKQGVEQDLMENARELLGKYTAANRDYDYMTEKLAQTAINGEKDPFLITTKEILGFCLMRDHQLIPTGDELKEPEQVIHASGKRPVVLPGSSRNKHEEKVQWARLWERIFMGVCGGVALIAPMLLMVLHKSRATTLATTSVATILFALMLALLGKNLRGQDVLAAVAAYAAVLVVFVGASST